MRSLVLIASTIFISLSSYGQAKIDDNVSSLKSVETLRLPALDNVSLKKYYKLNGKQSTALRFAEPRDVSIIPQKHGTWEQTQDNVMVWRQRIVSPNAHSINLAFTKFYLPPSASLFVYNVDKTESIGPLTKSDNDEHMQYWTPLITGQEVVIELQISPEELDDYKLELSRVNHDFTNIQKSFSGSCNIDVECGSEDGYPLVDEYRDIIRSVGAYTVGGIDACSGTLINNARNDCTPYFLTAEHCGIRTTNAASVVIYWNYQNSTCRQPNGSQSGGIGNGLRNQFNSGSQLRASLNNSDFALIELDDPIDPEMNLYFSGWNRQVELTDTSICIHHPGVEEKRISFDFDRLMYDNVGFDTTHILVQDWDIGTTEGGSSGAGIFNSRGELIGQLTGGLAACGNDLHDTYGWMNYSWEGAGTVSTSLQPWLDPDNTNLVSMQGRECSFKLILENTEYQLCSSDQNTLEIPLIADGVFEGPINYEVVGAPAGIVTNFDFDSNVVTVPNRLILSELSSVGESRFDIIISIDDGSNRVEEIISIFLYDSSATTPTLLSPADGAEDLPLSITLNLKRSNVPQNQFQISTDENFTDIIINEIIELDEYTTSNLQENQLYYWRSKSFNACGESDWSPVFSFSTSEIFCATISYLGEVKEISSDDPSTIIATTNLPYLFTVEDLVINNVSGTHSFVGDLSTSLSLDGLNATLFNNECFANDDYNLGFSDASKISTIECPPTSGEIYKPSSPLDIFDGAIALGDWNLNITDSAFDDGGTLQGWSMDVCYSNPVAPIIVPQNNILTGCYATEIVTDIYLDSGTSIPNCDIKVVNINSGNTIPSSVIIDIDDPNKVTLSVTPTDIDDGLALVQLINLDNNNIVFFTTVKLDLSNGSDKPIVTYPISGKTLNYDQISNVTWDAGSFSGDYIIEVSSDTAFSTLDLVVIGSEENDVVINPTNLGESLYYLRVGHKNACGYAYSEVVIITIDDSITISDDEDELEANVFPNPGSGIFYLRTNTPLSKGYDLIITDIQGRSYKLGVESINNYNLKLELQNYPSGVYYLQLVDQKISIKKKIIKI